MAPIFRSIPTAEKIFRPNMKKYHIFRPRKLICDLGGHILMVMQFTTPAIFQETIIPRNSELAGWAALVHAYGIQAPVRRLNCVSHGSIKGGSRQENAWTIFDKRTAPPPSLAGHLTFALRHETLDLLILKRLFDAVGPAEMTRVVRSETVGATSRRLWFLYEWLTGRDLDLPDAEKTPYVPILAPEEYVTAKPVNSPRHQVRDNLLGTPAFCPIIRRTPGLDSFISDRWDTQAKELVGRISKSVIARAASFLLLADSQASYQIEGERPLRNRLERWMRAVNQSGRHPLSIDELIRLQHIVVETGRFVTPGLRTEGGFIGPRDGLNDPLPEFVSARHDDVPSLLAGILDTSHRLAEDGIDAVLHATLIAFGFVFVHPFEDGNGRIHRYLIHHALAERGYTPPGIVFPVSSVILDRIEDYGETLRGFTGPLMPFIEWRPTPKQNVEVLNDTADLYRFGDYTELATFLYECVARTITHDLPREIEYLAAYDEAKRRIQDMIDMPENMLGNLIAIVRQNHGKLAKKRRNSDFEALSDAEVEAVERIISDAFALGEDEEHGLRPGAAEI